ncbi:collagen alpha-1(I) chain-like [Dama dama]|uniref:collagen alpha-1(I) chain-like n=1 Tax=Dama dama TaxID=30532 RepID=UPI002A36B294|nr:collagen alpha-1(I) chain-like [Dama dama]
MHGLIFETSICYWQDQPGRGASTRSRVCREQGGGWWPGTRASCSSGRAQKTREARKRGEGGVVGKAPTRPTGPHTRGEDARSRTQPSVHEGHSAPRRPPPREGTRGGARRAPLLLRTPPPPRRGPARPGGPGSRAGDPRPGHAADGRRALKRPSVPPTPEGRGTPGSEDTATGPREADRGPDPRSGQRIGAGGAAGGAGGRVGGGRGRSPSPSPRRRRRTGGGGKAGNRSGPRQARGSETRQGAAPGSSRWGADRGGRTDGRRRARTGCSHVTPTPQNRRWRRGWPRATARGMAQNDPGEASQPPGRTAGAHPSRGLTPTANPTHPEPQPAQENALPPRTGGPHSPHTRNPAVRAKAPPAPPPSQGSEGPAPPGDATGRRRPGDDTHVRRGRLGPRPRGTGVEGDTGGRTRGTRRKAGSGGEGPASTRKQGSRDGGEGAARRPENTRTQPGHQENQRGIPPPPTHEGGPTTPGTPAAPGHPWSGPHTPAPPPGPACRPPTFLHPSILNRSVFRLSLTPRLNILGTHSRARAAQTGGPPHRHRLRLRGKGGHDRLLLTTAAGLGEPGPTRQSHPNPPAFPLGSHHGAGCAHTAHARPPTRRTPGGARRDPPPTQRGEARAAVGNKSSTRPHRGAGAPITPLPHRGEGGFSAHVLWQSPRWPLHTREGQQLGGPEPPLNWAGGVCGIGKRATTQERVRGSGPPGKASPVSRHNEGSAQCFSYRLDPPPMGHTHTTAAGTRGGHRVKGKRHHHSASGT